VAASEVQEEKRVYVEPVQVVIRRNKSWRSSAWTGIKLTIWFAPLSLLRALMPGIAMLGNTAIYLVAILCAWIFTRVVFLIAGFAGHLCEVEPVAASAAKDPQQSE
jgi:hypothetical protein